VEAISEIRCRGQRSGARAAKKGQRHRELEGILWAEGNDEGGLELRLTGIERRRQGSSVAGKNGGRKGSFGRRGR
jgi:hypothetical protein